MVHVFYFLNVKGRHTLIENMLRGHDEARTCCSDSFLLVTYLFWRNVPLRGQTVKKIYIYISASFLSSLKFFLV